VKLITSIEELKKEATNESGEMTDFFIVLAGGFAKSSKRIIYFPETNTFDVHNEIDDSFEEDLTEEQLTSFTHIGAAIEASALYKY